MTTVYALIEDICKMKKISMRQLADELELPPSTLVTIQAKRAPQITKRILSHLGDAFGLHWYEFVTLPDGVTPDQITAQKVSANLSVTDKDRILAHIAAMSNLDEESAHTHRRMSEFLPYGRRDSISSADAYFKKSILLVMEKLNEEGVMEVLHHALGLVNDPKYCKEQKEEDT